MRLAKSIQMSIAIALALTMSVNGVAYAAAPTIDANAAGKIEGSGATFPWPQYTKWFATFSGTNREINQITSGTSNKQFSTSDSTRSLVLSYTGGGSGAGVTNFSGANRRSPTQMYSGSDAVLSTAERSTISGTDIGTDYSVIPMIAGPISAAYNVPGLKTSSNTAATLKLNGEVLCGIYIGAIKKWNADEIKALNPTVTNLPDATIEVVGRNDSSGTTFIFASFLGKASTVAQKNCGYHSNFVSNTTNNLDGAAGSFKPAKTQPGTYFSKIRTANNAAAITSKDGNAGIADYVAKTRNTIGYVESSYVAAYSLKEASVQARGGAFLQPTAATVAAALTNAVSTEDPINPSASYVQPVFAAGATSYPIVGISWLLVYHKYMPTAPNGNAVTKQQVQGMIVYLNWALSGGQASKELAAGYTPLPSTVLTTAINELHKIKFNNVVVWP